MLARLRRTAGAALTVTLATLAAASCDSATGLRTGELTVLLTDAPGDVVAAVVTIDQIYLQGAETGDDGRIILRDDDVTTDLLTLVGTTQSLIEDAEIPEGSYGQLRFVISGAYIAVEGEAGATTIYASSPSYAGLPVGATVGGSLQMPSLAQSGLKVQLPGDALVIDADGTVTLVVDFDVAQSFGRAAGGSGQWVMTPVLQGSIPPATP